MQRIVRELKAKGVTVEFTKEKLTFAAGTDNPMDELMFSMLGAFAQFERSLIRERQREGIAIAKAKGDVHLVRKVVSEHSTLNRSLIYKPRPQRVPRRLPLPRSSVSAGRPCTSTFGKLRTQGLGVT